MTNLRQWFLALRPWSFSMSFISVTLGSVWAVSGSWSWTLYLLTLLTMLLLHAAANLFNDYFDVKNKVDVPEAPTARYRPHPLAHEELSLKGVLWLAIMLYAAGISLGIALALQCGWPVLAIGIAGAGISLAYTARPVALKYYGLGELAVFLVWGPLAASAAYYVQTQEFSGALVLASIPFGILVALTLLANNLRDIEYDKAQNIHTVAVMAGPRRGVFLFLALNALAFLGIVVMAFTGPLSLWALTILLALPVAAPLCTMMFRHIPDDADARTAKLDIVFGALLILSVLTQKLIAG